jgi:ferredoxin
VSNVTFSSPVLARDITVYAVAGDRGTILAVAKEHKIPIPFDCQDGECGSCLVEVKHLSPDRKYGIALTEKEKEMLRQLGKITRKEIEDAEVNDMPPRYRLACQCFIRDEDIVVSFVGDETLPAQKPHLTPAAKIFKGGLKPTSVDDFLGYAVKVEEDAAVQRRAGSIDAAMQVPPDYVWPDHATPERTSLWAGDPSLSRLDALRAALVGEKRGFEFYYAVAGTTSDPDIRKMANEFVKEEAEHVEVLKAWITREEWAAKTALHAETV